MWLPLTPLTFLERSGRLFAKKSAVVDETHRFTYAECAERVVRLAGALRTLGLKPKEPVSFLSANTHHLLEAFYGVPLAGGVINPVNPRLAPLEIAELINDASSRIMVFHRDSLPAVRHILGNLKGVEQFVILEGDPKELDFPALEYESLLSRSAPQEPDLTGLDEDAPMALFYTSGGVAKMRGVLLSHRALHLHALYAVIAVGLTEEDVSLCSVPFSYMNGGGNPQMTVAVAATAVLARRTDPDTLLPLIHEERATVWITAPTVLGRLLRSRELHRFDLSSLRLILVGGAPLSSDLIQEAEEHLGAQCVQVYGLTETSPFVSAAFPKRDFLQEERRLYQARAGLPILGVEVRVVDEAGRPVPPDGQTVGEIRVRGNGVMMAYYRDPEATAEALAGGWLHTGDLATVDPEGYLTIRERKKDVILVGGMTVSAAEVEQVLASHPDVLQCTVLAAPDPDQGEAPIGLAVLRRGARITESELIEHCRERLSWFKVPRSIQFLGSLPTTESGAVIKSGLKTLYATL